jgi:hypothetical protein
MHLPRAAGAAIAGAVLVMAGTGCSGGDTKVVVRAADDVQVVSPAELRAMKKKAAATLDADSAASTDTVPQNADDRPVEQRLFEAFGKFRGCIEDSGETIRGNLQDPDNPAFDDPDYVQVLSKCAARSNIVEVFQEFQDVRANLTPEQVEERNESFKRLQPCLEDRGWTIETRTSEIGLIEPTTFVGPDGEIDERDVQQCAAEIGIDPSDWDG